MMAATERSLQMLLVRAQEVVRIYDELPEDYRNLLTAHPFHELHIAIDGNLRAGVDVINSNRQDDES